MRKIKVQADFAELNRKEVAKRVGARERKMKNINSGVPRAREVLSKARVLRKARRGRRTAIGKWRPKWRE